MDLSHETEAQPSKAVSIVQTHILNSPVDSAVTYRTFQKIWTLTGRNPPKGFVLVYSFYSLLFNLAVTIYLPASVLIQIVLFENIEALLKDFVFYVEILVTATKFFILWKNKDKFRHANELLAILDAKLLSVEERDEIKRITVRTQQIFKAYFSTTSFVIFWSAFGALLGSERHLLCEIWLPFEWHTSERNFWIAFAYETFAIYMLICISTTNDFYAPMYMMILNGHFNNLARRIESIGLRKPNELRSQISCSELINCINQHEIINEISTSLAPVISTTMSLQFLITAIALGMSVINIVYFIDNPFEMGKFVTVSSVVLLHVFPCCYFGQTYSDNNEKINNALFFCPWVDESQKFRSLMVLWMGFNQKKRYFLAGDIIPINLTTFASILKFTYSLATFMKHFKE